jgi:hypothetical protein
MRVGLALLLMMAWMTAAAGCAKDNSGAAGSGGTPGSGGSGGPLATGGSAAGGQTGGTIGTGGGNGGGAIGSGGTPGGSGGAAGTGGSRALAFQDNFESYPVGTFAPPAAWDHVGPFNDPATAQNLAVIDSTRFHGGGQSIKVGPGFIGAAIPSPNFFARVYAWFSSDPGDPHWWSFYGYTATPGNKDGIQVRFGGQGSKIDVNFNSPSGEVEVGGRTPPDPGVALPTGDWACFEFFFGANELRMWINDQEVTAFHITTWPNNQPPSPWSPAYQRFRIGYADVGGGGTTTVWFDDFALDPQRIGCQ